MLSVSCLGAAHGSVQVLFDLSFTVDKGETVALIGRNGAGKSTTLQTIIGLTRIVSGDIVFEGQSLLRQPVATIARRGLGWVPEDRRIFTRLTVRENLDVGRQPPREDTPIWDEERVLAVFPHLKGLLNRSAAHLSGGEQQMLTVARTLMGQPRLLLLDEPSEGIAPKVVDDMTVALKEVVAAGVSILLSEQNWGFASALADRAILLDQGRKMGEGRIADFVRDTHQLTLCLGL